jgi:hypothetical protein
VLEIGAVLVSGNKGARLSRMATVITYSSAPATADIGATAQDIAVGGSTTLNWSSSNATTCSATGAWSGSLALSGSQAVSPTTTSTYGISCGNGTSTSTDSVIITVKPVVSVSLMATPNPVPAGTSTLLSWTSTGADVCYGGGAWGGFKSTNGSEFQQQILHLRATTE